MLFRATGYVVKMCAAMAVVFSLNSNLSASYWNVTTFAGSTSSGYVDDTGTSARFNTPWGITIDSTNSNLYVTDKGNNLVRVVW